MFVGTWGEYILTDKAALLALVVGPEREEGIRI